MTVVKLCSEEMFIVANPYYTIENTFDLRPCSSEILKKEKEVIRRQTSVGARFEDATMIPPPLKRFSNNLFRSMASAISVTYQEQPMQPTPQNTLFSNLITSFLKHFSSS